LNPQQRDEALSKIGCIDKARSQPARKFAGGPRKIRDIKLGASYRVVVRKTIVEQSGSYFVGDIAIELLLVWSEQPPRRCDRDAEASILAAASEFCRL
jgi:hypothetical protein